MTRSITTQNGLTLEVGAFIWWQNKDKDSLQHWDTPCRVVRVGTGSFVVESLDTGRTFEFEGDNYAGVFRPTTIALVRRFFMDRKQQLERRALAKRQAAAAASARAAELEQEIAALEEREKVVLASEVTPRARTQ